MRVAVQYSKDLAIISYLDHGMAENLKDAGITLVSSATLIQRQCQVRIGCYCAMSGEVLAGRRHAGIVHT